MGESWKELIGRMASKLDEEEQQSGGESAALQRARAALESVREAEALWTEGGQGFIQLPERDREAEPAEDAPDSPATANRELATVRAAYEELKKKLAKSQDREEVLEQQLVALQQECDDLKARLRERGSAHDAGAVESTVPATGPAAAPSGFVAFTATGQKRRLGEILVEAGVITEEQLAELLEEQQRRPHARLGDIVVEHGITSEEIIARVLAAQLRLPYLDLDQYQVVEAAALQIPRDVARRHECIAIDGDLHSVTLAMANPLDLLAIEHVEIVCNRRVAAVVAQKSAVLRALERAYAG